MSSPSSSSLSAFKPILQTTSVVALSLAAGTNLSTTLVVLPSLLQSAPTTLATQWKTLFNSGIAPMATLSVTSAAGFLLLAYDAHSNLSNVALNPNAGTLRKERNLYLAAAGVALSLGPFTKVVMGSVIGTLEERAKGVKGDVKGAGGVDTHALVKEWGRLNLIRGSVLLGGAVVGMWACVGA